MNCNQIMDDIIDNEYMKKTDFSKKFDNCIGKKDKLQAITLLVEKYNCDFDDARMVCDFYIDGIPLPSDLSPQQQAYNNAVAREALNKPHCPTCNSTNIKKISGLSKAGSVAMFGIFSQKVKKQMHCNNCGYEW